MKTTSTLSILFYYAPLCAFYYIKTLIRMERYCAASEIFRGMPDWFVLEETLYPAERPPYLNLAECEWRRRKRKRNEIRRNRLFIRRALLEANAH